MSFFLHKARKVNAQWGDRLSFRIFVCSQAFIYETTNRISIIFRFSMIFNVGGENLEMTEMGKEYRRMKGR
jgi:hypothetical protein